MSQTVVNEFIDQWQRGQIATSHPVRDVAGVSEDASPIVPGQLLLRGSSDVELGVVKPTAAFTQKQIKGIILKPVSGGKAKVFSTGVLEFNLGDLMSIAQEADIAIELGGTVTAGDDAFFNHSGGGSRAQYTWGNDDDTANASQVPGQFLQSGVIGDIVLLRFNIDAVLGS